MLPTALITSAQYASQILHPRRPAPAWCATIYSGEPQQFPLQRSVVIRTPHLYVRQPAQPIIRKLILDYQIKQNEVYFLKEH